jgi:hypothetical protein
MGAGMLTDQDLERLFQDQESDRVERKEAASNRDRVGQAGGLISHVLS